MRPEITSLIEQLVKEEAAKIGEAKPFRVNPKYNVFALDKATNKIINGWDLDPKDKENIQDYIKKTSEYLKTDLKDYDRKPSQVTMGSVKSLKAKGIDPFNWDNWLKPEEGKVGEATTTIVTPDGKTMSQAQKDQVKNAKPGSTIVTKKAGEVVTEGIYQDVNAAKGKTIKVTLDNGKRIASKVVSVDHDKNQFRLEPPTSNDNKGTLVVGLKGDKAAFYIELGDTRGTVKTVDDEESKTYLGALAQMAHKNATATRHDAAPEFKRGLYEVTIEEKKKDEEGADAPVKDAPIEAMPAEGGSLSSELNDHISAAIDAAAKCIQDSGDKKYEKVLGKVIKNLTAAQDAIADVQAHETKLAEVAAAEAEKTNATYSKDLRKVLKKYFKNPDHIEAVVKKYGKVIKQSTDKPVDKIAEMITAHALKEGLVQKGDMLK